MRLVFHNLFIRLLLVSLIILVASSWNYSFSQSISLSTTTSYINLGELDIVGNKVTLEAKFYQTSFTERPNLVSKHTTPFDNNYLLRPESFELTTFISGHSGDIQFLTVPNPVLIEPNKWYHIAGVYDGNIASLYLNGCLVNQIPFSGNLIQNNITAAIGNQSDCVCEPFIGRIDEVRIWNTNRSAAQIVSNMNQIVNPANEPELKAYYKLNGNLQNQAISGLYNGVVSGSSQYFGECDIIDEFNFGSFLVTPASCPNFNNGSVTITTNRTNSTFSINGAAFTNYATFTGLSEGIYSITAKSIEGCIIDTVISIGLNLNLPTYQINLTICEGENVFGYTTSGIYIDTIASSFYCDTIRTLNLIVNATQFNEEFISICNGENYLGHTISGTYNQNYLNINGCDSIKAIVLTVNETYNINNFVHLCEGDTVDGIFQNFTNTTYYNSINGCDSTVNKIYIVHPITLTNLFPTICEGEIFEGYSANGFYEDTLQSIYGCDSIRTLTLTVIPTTVTFLNDTICSNFQAYGYNTTGLFTDTLTSIFGCDSIRVLNLLVHPVFEKNDTIILCEGDTFNFQNQLISAAGTYSITYENMYGCDSTYNLLTTVPIELFLGNDVYECYKSSVTLRSPYPNTFWYNNCIGNQLEVNTSGTYSAFFKNKNGCILRDSIEVTFPVKIFIPNTFTPNNDGTNDVFKPYFDKNENEKVSFKIFNRWGEMIYFDKDEDLAWNGMVNNKICQNDLYLYVVYIESEYCEREPIRGLLMLVN